MATLGTVYRFTLTRNIMVHEVHDGGPRDKIGNL